VSWLAVRLQREQAWTGFVVKALIAVAVAAALFYFRMIRVDILVPLLDHAASLLIVAALIFSTLPLGALALANSFGGAGDSAALPVDLSYLCDRRVQRHIPARSRRWRRVAIHLFVRSSPTTLHRYRRDAAVGSPLRCGRANDPGDRCHGVVMADSRGIAGHRARRTVYHVRFRGHGCGCWRLADHA